MGIYRRSEPTQPPASAAADDVGGVLAERLRAIAASVTPEDALEPALQAIVEAIGVQAGAVCLFDMRSGLLRLATEVGISDEGCRSLRRIRKGDAEGWELPLQSLHDRRAYLIDAAQGAQHLPTLLEGAAAMSSIACIPLSAAETPVGSLILAAVESRAISERDIQQLEGPLAELARMIEAARRPRVGTAAPAPPTADGVIAEPGGLRSEIAAHLAERASLAAKLAARSDEVARLRQALEAAGAERARLAGEIEQARQAAERADLFAASLAAAERERRELQTALETAVAGQAQAEAEHEVTRYDVENILGRERAAAAEEIARLRARVAEAEAATRRERDQLRGSLAELRTEQDRLAAEMVAATESRALLESRLARETEERTRLGSVLATAEQALAAAEESARVTSAEVARLTAERDAASAALAERRSEPPVPPGALSIVSVTAPEAAALAPPSPPAPAAPARRAPPLSPLLRPAAPAPPAARAALREARGARRVVAVLDIDPAWGGAAAIEGTEIVVVKPVGDVVAQLAAATPIRVVVNLAAPGALVAMSALRAAGASSRFWGCLAASTSATALPLGMIEPATRPLDTDAVLPVLGGYATRGTRVVTAGADGDSLMSLRHALTRQGLSVSMAWDAKQAVELFAVVHPELVVLDLELPPRNGYELVVRLAGASPVPSAVLVYSDGDDTGAGFTGALRGVAPSALVPRDRLLADVLGQSEAPPEQRQQNVRAVAQRR